MRRLLIMIVCVGMLTAMVGCGSEELSVESASKGEAAAESDKNPSFPNLYPSFIKDETENTVTYVNADGAETTVTKNPEKTAVLFNSHLGLWYFTGGTSLTKVKGTSNVPEEAMDLMDMGSYSSVSLEAVIALEPSLAVLADRVDHHKQLAPSLKEMGIEVILVEGSIHPYERFCENAYLFSKINGTEQMYAEKIQPIVDEVETIIKKAAEADSRPRVAAILVSSKNLSLDSELAQVGEMVDLLGGQNIYSESDIVAEGETRIPFSIEALVTQNPEVILISTMGSIEDAQANVAGMIAENPVWQEVDAVKNNRVFYLDKDLSVYKPNQRYAEAFQMIAEKLYPELY